jgi:hypothetical protein
MHFAQAFHPMRQPAALGPLVAIKSELDAQSATVFHRLATACASRLYPSASTETSLACDLAWFISHSRQMTNATMFGQTRQGISCII